MPTVDKVIFGATLIAALGSGLIAGVFFIFSITIMRALERVPNGMVAMQSINLVILSPTFLGVFMGTALICIALAVFSILRWDQPGAAWLLTGTLLYLIGSIALTMIFNVPMNNALVAADPANPEGEKVWADYLVNWTRWNHMRTIASLAASASFILAIART